MSLKAQQDDPSGNGPDSGNQFDDQLRDRMRDHSSPVRPDAWRRIQNGLAAAPARRRAVYWPYLALIVAAGPILFIGRGYLRYHAAPHSINAHVSPAPSANAGNPTEAPAKTVNPTAPNAPSGASPTAAPAPTAAATPSPEKMASTTSAPPDRSFAATKILSSKKIPAHPTHRLTQTTPILRHRPAVTPNTAAQTAAAAPIPTQATKLFFPREPHPFTLPALAKFGAPISVTAASPAPFGDPGSPNPYAGASFFDHFYLSLFGATGFPTHYYALSYTGGVRLSFQFDRHWSATSGVQVSRVNMNYHGITDSNVQILPKYFINLDLPLLVGYTFTGDHYTFTINGGAIVNLYSRVFGRFPEAWPKHTGPSAYLGLAYTRPLNDQWSVFAEPYVRCLFTRNEPILPARIWSTGLQLGLKYHL